MKISADALAPLLQVNPKTLQYAKIAGLRPGAKIESGERSRQPKRRDGGGWSGRGEHWKREASDDEAKPGVGRAAPAILEPRDKVARALFHCQNLTLLLENRLVDESYRTTVRDLAKLKIAINEYLARGQEKEVG